MDWSEPECASSLSVRSIPSVERSSRSTGPTSRDSRTCESSQPRLFPGFCQETQEGNQEDLNGLVPRSPAPLLTSSPGASPVRTSRPPGRVPGSEEHAPVSGAKWRGSLPSVVRRGSSLRTSLLCALEELTGYSLIWKRSVTTHGRWWWVLGRSARRTDGIGSGSWATPNTMEGGQTSRGGKRKGELLLGGQVKTWPTPTEGDGKASGSRIGNPNTKAHPGVSLTDATARAWPTPRSEDSEQTGPHGENRDTLTSAAQEWPTPSATPYGSSNNGNPHDYRTEYATKGKPSLEGFARQWPSPRASDERGPSENRISGASDGSTRFQLRESVHAGPPDPASLSTSGKPRGSLNSRWVAQLQGYPADWCALPVEQIAKLSKPLGTQSFPKLSPKSGGRS